MCLFCKGGEKSKIFVESLEKRKCRYALREETPTPRRSARQIGQEGGLNRTPFPSSASSDALKTGIEGGRKIEREREKEGASERERVSLQWTKC